MRTAKGLNMAMLVVGLASSGTPTMTHAGWALLAGLGSAAGSIFLLRGLSRGRMAVVAPTSAVGAAILPVVAGFAAGEHADAMDGAGHGSFERGDGGLRGGELRGCA